jgi:hypothetical protein
VDLRELRPRQPRDRRLREVRAMSTLLHALAGTVIVICYGCAGSRKEPDGKTPCRRCGGTGRDPNP